MNKEFFRGMKEQIEPDEEQVEELKNKLKNTAAVSRQKVNKRCGFCGESTPLYLYNQQKHTHSCL